MFCKYTNTLLQLSISFIGEFYIDMCVHLHELQTIVNIKYAVTAKRIRNDE